MEEKCENFSGDWAGGSCALSLTLSDGWKRMGVVGAGGVREK